jgi:DNA-binding GntR family transcriptional regulator
LIETRCLVESAALRASIAQGDAAWEERALVSHHRLARTPRSADPDRFISNPDWEAHHRAFHLALLSGCGAQALLTFCADPQDRALRFRNLSNQVAWPQRDVAAEHKALCDAAIGRRRPAPCSIHTTGARGISWVPWPRIPRGPIGSGLAGQRDVRCVPLRPRGDWA